MMESALLNVQKDKRESRSFGSLEKRARVERLSKRMAFTESVQLEGELVKNRINNGGFP